MHSEEFEELHLSLCVYLTCSYGLPRWFSGKESTCQCRRPRFNLWARKIPWRRVWKRQKLVVLYDKKKSSINYMKLRMNAFREMNNV